MATEIQTVLDKYPEYELCIGIEVHVQLTTKSKIFCSCSNGPAQEPNTNICEVCSGYPGTLPVLNKAVIDNAIMAGLGTHSLIAPLSEFARKHYFYPDLPKGYQITQHTKPICTEGHLTVRLDDGSTKKVRLIRIHIEEDAGKNIHSEATGESFVDLNRAGTPLLEIVSYPDITSSHEARAYLKALHMLVRYLGISTGNMEEGAFRADTNISVRKKGQKELGTRCELKNINSFKYIADAIEYEAERQIKMLESGGVIEQQTRLWNTQERKTFVMRTKEEAADYRYFADPDLPLIEVTEELVERVRARMPELPEQKFERYIAEFGLSPYEADILIEDRQLSNYFEEAYSYNQSKQVVNWILRDLMGYVKEHKITIVECNVTPKRLASIVTLLETGVINNRAAQQIFEVVAQTGNEPEVVVKEQGLQQIGSQDELEKIVRSIIDENPDVVVQYKSGKDKLFGFFVGQAMKKAGGNADPKMLQALLKKYLA